MIKMFQCIDFVCDLCVIPPSLCFPTKLIQDVLALEVLCRLDQPVAHGLLSGAQRHARVVVLLVGLVGSVGVADLPLQVFAVSGLVFAHAVPEPPLGVGVDVHLDDAGLDGVLDVLDGGAGACDGGKGED